MKRRFFRLAFISFFLLGAFAGILFVAKKSVSHPPIKHVFVIIEENHDWKDIYKNPDASYINNVLLAKGAYASDYHNVPVKMGALHPSEPSYILIESGKVAFPDVTFTTDDSPSATHSTGSKEHLTTLLVKNGYTWKSYQEDIPGNDCPIYSIKDYAPKHNPVLFFQDVSGNPPSIANAYCQRHVRPFNELETDLKSGNVPNYSYITPNLQHDMHNGTIKQADTWLSQVVPQIINSDTFKKDGALFITWDEGKDDSGAGDNNPIGMIMLSPYAKKGYTNNVAYSHTSLFKTVEEIFNLTSLPGIVNDPQTRDLFDFFSQTK